MKLGNYSCLFQGHIAFRDKENAFANLGDNIIALAIDSIYQTIGISTENIIYVNKDDTRKYNGEYIVLPACLNLWDFSLDLRLPMSPKIYPIFISVVANRDVFIDRPDLIEYFKKYEPIGCRDEQTVEIFRKYGIEAYLMGCHTICFPKRKNKPKNGKIFLIDTSEELEKFIPQKIRNKCEYLTHAVPYKEYPVTSEENNRLNEMAKKLLNRYANEAELIVTSRLHAATPCIAMGIPVIVACDNIDFRFGWLDKYIKLYSLEEFSSIDWDPKPVELEQTKEWIIKYIRDSINRTIAQREELFNLSEFYENRNKTIFYQLFRKRLEELLRKFNYNSDFPYVIWGSGQHCYYAYGLISEIFPKAKLTAIVDKYQTGRRLGVEIIKEAELGTVQFKHVFITTAPGKMEAIKKLECIHGHDAHNFYTLIISQQIS